MDYQKHYNLLIARAHCRPKPEGYTERHHIVPTSLGGTDDRSNLVILTAKEHYVAHSLLAKIHGGSMWRALYLMSSRLKMKSSVYEQAKMEFSMQQRIIGKEIGVRNYKNGVGLAGISVEDRKKIASKGGKLGGHKGGSNPSALPSKRTNGIKAKELKEGIHAPGVASIGAKASGKIASENGQIQKLQLKVASIGGRASCLKRNYERYRCLECEFAGNMGHIGRHQKKANHSGRVKL